MNVLYGNVSAARAAVEVLAAARRPLTLTELQHQVSDVLGRPVLGHSLRAAVYYHLGGEDAWFERAARGRYRLAPSGQDLLSD